MRIPLDVVELEERIERNRNRLLTGEEYSIKRVFPSVTEYDWKGDMEGRALLAFMSHYKINRSILPCMEQFLSEYRKKTGGKLYFEAAENARGILSEQQLSGHSWLLRGFCEHYECFGDRLSLEAIKTITEALYLPLLPKLASYPLTRNERSCGGVSGEQTRVVNGWHLSTDTGCAFMSIDGLSHAYGVTSDGRIKELLDAMTDVFMKLDKVAVQAQTHCTLTAARGMLRMCRLTAEEKYLNFAKEIYTLYTQSGMTYTYQNLNWWGRPDSWSEPCAVVDSLMLSLALYKVTGEETYRRTAARIYANGFASMQRDNGGAGTDTLVTPGGKDFLRCRTYEAWFCCTMRLAEGLWYINANRELLYTERYGRPTKNENGVYMDGDIVFAAVEGGAEQYAGNKSMAEVDGLTLMPLVKYYKVPRKVMENSIQHVLYGKN